MNTLVKYSRIPLAVAFFAALANLPYGYYELLRTAATVMFVAYGVFDFRNNNEAWAFFWFGSALLINPLVKIALGRPLWNLMDLVWGGILLYKNIHRSTGASLRDTG